MSSEHIRHITDCGHSIHGQHGTAGSGHCFQFSPFLVVCLFCDYAAPKATST